MASVFRDANGNEWRVSLDAFVLDDVRKQTGVDLADISAGGWHQVESDAGAAVRVLAVVCGDHIRATGMSTRVFAKSMRGDAITEGRAALLSEGADFFPLSEWSAIRSNLAKRTEAQQQTTDLMTAQAILGAMAAMPAEMRAGAIEAMQSAMGSSSQSSEPIESVTGPASIPLERATDLLASVDLTAVG